MLGVEVLTCAGRTPVAADEGKNVSEVPSIPVDAQVQGAVVEEGRVAEGLCVGGGGLKPYTKLFTMLVSEFPGYGDNDGDCQKSQSQRD